jgi:hypothetical protein
VKKYLTEHVREFKNAYRILLLKPKKKKRRNEIYRDFSYLCIVEEAKAHPGL